MKECPAIENFIKRWNIKLQEKFKDQVFECQRNVDDDKIHWEWVQDKAILFFIDNADLILQNDFPMFVNLLENLLEIAPRSKLLMTS